MCHCCVALSVVLHIALPCWNILICLKKYIVDEATRSKKDISGLRYKKNYLLWYHAYATWIIPAISFSFCSYGFCNNIKLTSSLFSFTKIFRVSFGGQIKCSHQINIIQNFYSSHILNYREHCLFSIFLDQIGKMKYCRYPTWNIYDVQIPYHSWHRLAFPYLNYLLYSACHHIGRCVIFN